MKNTHFDIFSKSEAKLMCGILPGISTAGIRKWAGFTSRMETTEKALALVSPVKQFFQNVMEKNAPQNKQKQISRTDSI